MLERARAGELLSEGLVTGAIQVPPSGQPILLLPDHPTTGGYPVIAVVVADDLWLAGQLAPSMRCRFRQVPFVV
jgi:allophanate hydrolase subunit 2